MNLNTRSLVLVAAALLVAGITAFMARSLLNTEPQTQVAAVTQKVDGPEVLVASKNLPTGTLLAKDHLRWQAWPDDTLAESYMRRDKRTMDEFFGAVVRQGMAQGEPLSAVRVVKPGERSFLAAVLSPGMRAISVPISATSGISGFVFPGDRVDLILTHEFADGAGVKRRVSETVLVNVRVLAVDQRMDDQTVTPSLAKTATLEVTPKQVEKVTVLRRLGQLSLSLRSLVDEKNSPLSENASLEPAKPVAGGSFTWDSEVSKLLGSPDVEGEFDRVQVSRGNKVAQYKFRRQVQ